MGSKFQLTLKYPSLENGNWEGSLLAHDFQTLVPWKLLLCVTSKETLRKILVHSPNQLKWHCIIDFIPLYIYEVYKGGVSDIGFPSKNIGWESQSSRRQQKGRAKMVMSWLQAILFVSVLFPALVECKIRHYNFTVSTSIGIYCR